MKGFDFWDATAFLFGKDGRKFLKRKDSDAGEAGRTLEEIRASIFSEFRTSEGARRQQQRFCGPFVAMTFNFFVGVSIIMANKIVLGDIGFNFPIFLTFIHYIVSWLLLALFRITSLLPVCPPSKSTPFSSLFALGTVMALSNGLANVSLKYNSIGFYQMAKIAVTPTIVLAEFMLFGKRITFNKVLALAVVSLGVAVATVTDLQFNYFGAFVALTWIVPSAVNKILWSNLQQRENWTALALMWKTTPVTLLFLAALMPWLDPPGVLLFDWSFRNTVAILISAALGFLLQLSGALALGATSATSHVILGQFKTCVILLGGSLYFHTNPGLVSTCGAAIALLAMSVYTSLNLRQVEPETKLPSNAASFLPKPRTKEETVTSIEIVNATAESV
ncbi:nucleotide-sugar uncharacterized transporter 2-like isoform X1 [Nymphaea colorata]|nr:nucleotide-sugar uncharacterized transporter 2-like isoform X1 [Nymphaea colorata]XP_031493746.1 nucleotide-sugar uncharacterized transporter 2-like isoform X1 [Nymphaea colorata]